MFKTKVYLYDSSQEHNGYRGQDFSKYVLQGDQNGEDITQEMDTAEITLCGLSFEKGFDPETKFIVDFVETQADGTETILETNHRIVARDTPNKPILSDDHYFDHHISLTEPSAVAQKRLVDNISTTYKLKDVTLEQLPAFDNSEINWTNESSAFVPEENFGYKRNVGFTNTTRTWVWGKYFRFDGVVEMLTVDDVSYPQKYLSIDNFETPNGYFAKFKIPKLEIYGGLEGTKNFGLLGYASIDYQIDEYDVGDPTKITNSWKGNFISNSNLASNTNYYRLIEYSAIESEWLFEGEQNNLWGVKKYTETSATTPNYITATIPINPDKQYKVTISIHEFDDNFPAGNNCTKYTGATLNKYVYKYEKEQNTGSILLKDEYKPYALTDIQTDGVADFVTYNIDTGTLVYSQSTPYSALALLQKAIINSSLYEKQDGVYIADVNNSNLPFYIDTQFVDELSSALIIENFYNQKNLWEIMIEVGHYIHSIPELKFGENDRFMITFNRLGRTDEKQNKSTKVSIYNSRNIEDYLSATSSYITNMVQLGGYVEEWVSPKTTNENYLVSNDTAEIIVSKPIIELLELYVKNNTTGQVARLTPFIYEENVYKTLDLHYQANPNRGIAMYYKLGTNVITGGQFQLPQANTNPFSDYAIKKIIWCAFNSYSVAVANPTVSFWGDLLIKDYSFFVQYRTKDSVRQNHIRPDLRKYLLNSKHDRFPEHNQFNNQTDVVVDSVKFGNNIYGSLIKTGNNSYTTMEWNNRYENLKHKGELYRINAELYYVAKVMHYRYSSYILSEITYSKDYNELSAVIGIPSEPRFYEISEQSLIWREFAINDLLLLTDDKEQLNYGSNYVVDLGHLSQLVIGEGTDFAKYAITVYKGDKDKNKYSQTAGLPSFYKEVFNPINAYSSENTLTYEWDMIDNYSAGDKVAEVGVDTALDINKRAYSSLKAVPYTDIYGKAPLLDFYILGDIKIPDMQDPSGYRGLTTSEIMALPECPIKTKADDNDTRPFVGDLDILGTNVKGYDANFNGRGIGLLKDCREALAINFNLQLATNSDTFVLSPYVFLPKKENLKIVLLAEEVNKLSSGYINNNAIITPIDINGNQMNPYFDFTITTEDVESVWDNSKRVVTNFGIDFETIFANVAEEHFTANENFQRVKSIVVLCDVSLNPGVDSGIAATIPYKTQFVFARNIPEDWGKGKATKPVYFGAPNKNELFKNKQ